MLRVKFNPALVALFFILATTLAGCEVVGGILKIGFWAGIIFVILIVLIIRWVMKSFRGRP